MHPAAPPGLVAVVFASRSILSADLAAGVRLLVRGNRAVYCCFMNIPSDWQARQHQDIPPYFWPEYQGPLRLPPLPTPGEIAAARDCIPSPRWRLVFGLLATYGIRPGEVTALRFPRDGSDCPIVRGKDGDRQVVPAPREWVAAWELQDLAALPRFTNLRGSTVAGVVAAKFLREYTLPFELRCLRLAYYQRVLEQDTRNCTELAG